MESSRRGEYPIQPVALHYSIIRCRLPSGSERSQWELGGNGVPLPTVSRGETDTERLMEL